MWPTNEQKIYGETPPWYNGLLTEELTVSLPEELEKSTRNQSENHEWFKNRTNQITVVERNKLE